MRLQSTVIQICSQYHDGTSIIRTIAIGNGRKCDVKYGVDSKTRYCEKGRERACALRVTLPSQKGDRSSVKDVWHYASVPAQNPARRPRPGASRKIPTWRFLSHRPPVPNKTDDDGGREARTQERYTANTSARCISGDTAVWIGDKPGPSGRGWLDARGRS